MTTWQKLGSVAALLIAWGALVIMGKVPADAYIAAIQGALVALGVYHIKGGGQS